MENGFWKLARCATAWFLGGTSNWKNGPCTTLGFKCQTSLPEAACTRNPSDMAWIRALAGAVRTRASNVERTPMRIMACFAFGGACFTTAHRLLITSMNPMESTFNSFSIFESGSSPFNFARQDVPQSVPPPTLSSRLRALANSAFNPDLYV